MTEHTQNFINDFSFENQKSGSICEPWQVMEGNPLIETDSENSNSGKCNLLFIEDGLLHRAYQIVPVQKNTSYKLSACIFVSANMRKFRMDVFGDVINGADIGNLLPNSRNCRAFGSNRDPEEIKEYQNGYKRAEFVFFSEDCEKVAVVFGPVGGGQNPAGAWMRVDDVYLEQVDFEGELDTDDRLNTDLVRCKLADTDTALEEFDHIVQTWTGNPATSITLSWKTAESKTGFVQYEKMSQGKQHFNKPCVCQSKQMPFEAGSEGDPIILHRADITNLEPDKAYRFRVGNGINWSEEGTFHTVSKEQDEFSFLIFGDSQNGSIENTDYEIFKDIAKGAFARHTNVRFFTITGDLTQAGMCYTHWYGWFEAVKDHLLHVPIMPVMGNHEFHDIGQKAHEPLLYLKQFPLPENGPKELIGQTYFFELGRLGMAFINSNIQEQALAKGLTDRERKALEEAQLLAVREFFAGSSGKWKAVFTHAPVFFGSTALSYREFGYDELFAEMEVDLVFAGHSHRCYRSKPVFQGKVAPDGEFGTVHYVCGVSGQAAGKIPESEEWMEFSILDGSTCYLKVDVKKSMLNITIYNAAGEVLDSYEICKD